MSNFTQDLIICTLIAIASIGWMLAVSMGWA